MPPRLGVHSLRLIGSLTGATPTGMLALPSTEPGAFHRLALLFGGSYVRVYPGGPFEPGVVFPVRDPHAALEICRDGVH